MVGGMHGRGVRGGGMRGRQGCAWQVGGVHGRGTCVVGGGGACMAYGQ